jgi:hypothetical protein
MTTISQARKINRVGSRRYPLRAFVLAFLLAAFGTPSTAQTPTSGPPESLSASEFSRLINEFSEEGGYFLSDNFTSNETSYLHVVDKLRELGATGGAYIGVGPEQNFTYIAKIRPRIAFIIDIRRQAIIQHLMFKAIFHLAPDRTQFLARLLSRPAPPANGPSELNQILAYFSKTPASEQLYAANLAAIKKAIQEDFQFPLSEADQKSLMYVYQNFRTDGLDIAFRMDGSWGGSFPTLKELIVETDLQNKPGHFLTSKEDYDFVRDLHRRNLIIPVVGDFAGRKALAAIGGYLKKQGLTVTAFYTSNVEQYLFEGGSDVGFVNNVRKLPINDHSFFIRAIINMRYQHPEQLAGHFSTTLLQRMDVFVQDFDAGRYRSYTEMITTHYIAADKPGVKK